MHTLRSSRSAGSGCWLLFWSELVKYANIYDKTRIFPCTTSSSLCSLAICCSFNKVTCPEDWVWGCWTCDVIGVVDCCSVVGTVTTFCSDSGTLYSYINNLIKHL